MLKRITNPSGCPELVLNLLDISEPTMWKAVGSVQSDERSQTSNRSRADLQAEPFHEGLRRRSNFSPEANRSFCQDYFDRHRNNFLNMTSYSNKSEKASRLSGEKEDMFT